MRHTSAFFICVCKSDVERLFRLFDLSVVTSLFMFYFYDLNLAVFVVSGIKYIPTALSDDTIRSNVRSAADIVFLAEGS